MYTFYISDSILKKQEELLSHINVKKDVFYTSSRGVNETNIVISSSMNELVESVFEGEKMMQKAVNLSAITVKLPEENVSTSGIYYFIFQRLAWEGVVIKEVISTTNEFTILVNDDQIDIAFKVVKDLRGLK